MDKKKVKELTKLIYKNVGSIKGMRGIDDEYQEDALNYIKEVQEELNKSDWVSVEDGLPEYSESVWVRSLANPDEVWTTRRTTQWEYEGEVLDSNNFINVGHSSITHWKPIEKLEE